MKRLVLALTALLSACLIPDEKSLAPPDGTCRTFVVAPEFTEAERAALERAVVRWNAIAIEPFCLRDGAPGEAEVTDNGVFRVRYRSEYWQQISARLGGSDWWGVHFGARTHQIGIVDILGIDVFELVALHEFGHAHGLVHTGPPAIMTPGVGGTFDFTEIDMAECRRVGACASGDGAAAAPVFEQWELMP